MIAKSGGFVKEDKWFRLPGNNGRRVKAPPVIIFGMTAY